MICKYVLPFCGLSFHVFDGVICSTKGFNFYEVVACGFGVVSKKPLTESRWRKCTPMLLFFFKEFYSFNF